MLRDVPKLQGTDRTELTALIGAVDKEYPEKTDVDRLKKILDENPAIYEKALSMSGGALRTALTWITGGRHPAMEDIYAREIDALAIGLGYDSSSTIERMLIQTILISWVRLQAIEKMVVVNDTGKNDIEIVEYYDRRLTQAQRRLLRSTEGLARLRRLLQPKEPQTQINVATQQGVQMLVSHAVSGLREEAARQSRVVKRVPAKSNRKP